MKINLLNIQTGQRGLILGATRSGKSTLAEHLIDDTVTSQAKSRTLIIDTKPRFRADRLMTGTAAKRLYRNWRGGAFVPYSYRLPVGDDLSQQVWDIARRGTPGDRGIVVIAQTNEENYFDWLNHVIDQFYNQARKQYDEFVYVDEMLQFFGGRPTLQRAVKKVICSGGEIGVQFLGSSQRPKEIPNACMSEMTKCFLFKMDYGEDLSKLRKMGVPPDFTPPDRLRAFAYYDKWEMIHKHQLQLVI